MTMSNTTMGSHNMTGHDMSMDHGSMDHTSGHTNIFHFSVEAVILFAGWKTVTWTEMLGSCVGVALLAMMYEGLKVLREYLEATFRSREQFYDVNDRKQVGTSNGSVDIVSKNDDSITGDQPCKQRTGLLRPAHWLQTLLHFVQLWISLTLMLVFMTFNVYLCLAVTIGGAVGYFCFAWIHRPGRRYGSDLCH